MSVYDYRAGKKRIDAILNNKLEVKTQHQLPSDDNFTFDNGYYSWITAIFVDLRNSSTLFANGDKEKVAKIAKKKAKDIQNMVEELVSYAVEKGSPVLEKAANAVREKAIDVTKEVLAKLEKEN